MCDELAAYLEPDETHRDDARARPAGYQSDTLYLWPAREAYERSGTIDANDAYTDRVDFLLQFAWAADRNGEGEARDRDVSDTIAARLTAYTTALRAHPTGSTYGHIRLAAVDHEGIHSVDVRGFMATLEGWRFEESA